MKKITLFIALLALLMPSITAQEKANVANVARECVLFELFTGVRCPYCPAAANGVAQLLEEGKAIAPVAYHTSAFSTEDYYTNETQARASYYGISSYPTLKADGLLSSVGGGSASETNYPTYLGRYNQRVNVTSPFTIDLTCEPGDNNMWTVHCTVNQVGDCPSTNVKVMIALTQCNIDVGWMGMQGLHHVCRDMIPTQQGTTFVGPTMTIDQTFQMNWPKEDCFLTAWVQNYTGNKEVYQAVRLSTDLNLDYDLVLKEVKDYATSICSGLIRPVVSVKNCGNEVINDFEVVAKANGVEVHRETWFGSLAKGETVIFPMIEFDKGDATQLSFEVVNPNGQQEEFEGDNTLNITLDEPVLIDGYLKIQVKTDSHPEETMIQIVNMDTDEVVHELTFDEPSHVYTHEPCVMNAGCYRIRILDSAGDGFTGIIRVTDASGTVLLKVDQNKPFTEELVYEFSCDGAWGVEDHAQTSVELRPNPSNGRFFLDLGEGSWQVEVYDLAGRLIHQVNDFVRGEVDMNCGSGIYFLKATNGEEEVIRKVMVY